MLNYIFIFAFSFVYIIYLWSTFVFTVVRFWIIIQIMAFVIFIVLWVLPLVFLYKRSEVTFKKIVLVLIINILINIPFVIMAEKYGMQQNKIYYEQLRQRMNISPGNNAQ